MEILPTVAVSTFFCRACLNDRPIGEQSLDPRYYGVCCDFLVAESRELLKRRTPAWAPSATPPSSSGRGSGESSGGLVSGRCRILKRGRGRPRKEGALSRTTC